MMRIVPRRDEGRGTFRSICRAAAEVAAETIWPTRCVSCDMPGELLCERCAGAFPYIDLSTACPRCGAPHSIMQCTECNTTILGSLELDSIPLAHMASVMMLNASSKRVIASYKDKGERRLSTVIAAYMDRYILPELRESRTPITFIPATERALRRRGFDHMECIADALSSISGMPLVSLFERPHTSDQRKLGRKGRIENMHGILKVSDAGAVPPQCLVIDDVCTTGATLYAAADVLIKAGVESVYGLTFGRVMT